MCRLSPCSWSRDKDKPTTSYYATHKRMYPKDSKTTKANLLLSSDRGKEEGMRVATRKWDRRTRTSHSFNKSSAMQCFLQISSWERKKRKLNKIGKEKPITLFYFPSSQQDAKWVGFQEVYKYKVGDPGVNVHIQRLGWYWIANWRLRLTSAGSEAELEWK